MLSAIELPAGEVYRKLSYDWNKVNLISSVGKPRLMALTVQDTHFLRGSVREIVAQEQVKVAQFVHGQYRTGVSFALLAQLECIFDTERF